MSRPILLTLIILLSTTLRYHLGISDFWIEQSYLVRELMSSSYKILWMLIPALLIFPEQRRQKIGIRYSYLGVAVVFGLGIALGAGKWIAAHYFPQTLSDTNIFPFTLFFTLIVNSFCEEYVFRGILMQYLETRQAPRQAMVFQSLLFALIHIPFYISLGRSGVTSLGGLVGVFLLGLFFAIVRKKTNSLFYPMLVHSVRNGMLIFL